MVGDHGGNIGFLWNVFRVNVYRIFVWCVTVYHSVNDRLFHRRNVCTECYCVRVLLLMLCTV